MREFQVSALTEAVKNGFLHICTTLDPAVCGALSASLKTEPQEATRFVLDIMIKNAEIAKAEHCPVCQDTGMAVVFLEVGQEVHFVGGDVEEAVNQGVRQAYLEGAFRKSVLSPLTRINTQDNTPCVLHFSLTRGSGITLRMMAKGFGSENMSRLFMLPPAAGIAGVKDCIVQAVADAGANPCPPVIVGVGIGGTMEKASLLSKKALFRQLNSTNEDPILEQIETETLARINNLKIGAMGLGGQLSALAVFCASYPTHLAGLPVAITMQCHAARHIEVAL